MTRRKDHKKFSGFCLFLMLGWGTNNLSISTLVIWWECAFEAKYCWHGAPVGNRIRVVRVEGEHFTAGSYVVMNILSLVIKMMAYDLNSTRFYLEGDGFTLETGCRTMVCRTLPDSPCSRFDVHSICRIRCLHLNILRQLRFKLGCMINQVIENSLPFFKTRYSEMKIYTYYL